MDGISLRGLQIGDAGWLIEQHAVLYAAEEGFDATFEPLVAEILADFLRNHDPSCERGWIAEKAGRRLASIFCVKEAPGVAKLRLFLVVPEARGTGLGHLLLKTCLAFAKARDYRVMRLWTHESHEAACALYRKYDFRLTEAKPVHSFGRDLVEQSWEIDL